MAKTAPDHSLRIRMASRHTISVSEIAASMSLAPCTAGVWNEDGHLDLLVGDAGDRFEKHLSEEEMQWRAEAKQQQAKYLNKWSQGFANYRKLMSEAAGVVDENRAEHQLKLATA